MARFRGSDDFGPTLDAAAERLGISPTAVEKDYWVGEVLRVLARDFDDDFIFKGGTSLSKGYGIVERFSEDVDVLVLPGERGRGATDRLMKDMGAAAAEGIGGTAAAVGASEKGRHRAYEVTYPATRQATALLGTSVLLEMGVRGGPHPNQTVPIGSLLGDALVAAGTDLDEFDDLRPFPLAALHPGRTLLEKLVLVHGLAQDIAAERARPVHPRQGRHFYDVYQLLGDGRVLEMLSDRPQVLAVMSSVEAVTLTHFPSTSAPEVRPAGGFGDCPAFDTGSEVSTRLRAAYEAGMPELYFGTAPLPTWDAICA